jgi:methanogenic corrinoid protein MtbC1
VITLTFTSDGGSTTFENNEPSVEENSIADTIIGTLKAEYEDTSQDMVFDIKESNGLEIVKLSGVSCSTEVGIYTQTCIKRSALGQRKSDLLRQVTS